MSSTTDYRRYHTAVPEGYETPKPFLVQVPPNGWTASTAPGPLREFSLIFVVDVEKRKVLLGKKRRGVGVGLYNGFGGKPEHGETILQCAERELKEESLLGPLDSGFWRVGHLELSRPKHGGREVFRIVVFGCTAWQGEPRETDEMTPEWFDIPLSIGDSAGGRRAGNGASQTYPLLNMWPEAMLFHETLLTRILRTAFVDKETNNLSGYTLHEMGTAGKLAPPTIIRHDSDGDKNRELIAKFEYDHVDPTTVQPWTLIRRHHSNDPMLEDDVQEALTGWFLAWGSDQITLEAQTWD